MSRFLINIFYITTVCFSILPASTLTLKHLLNTADKDNLLSKSLDKQSLAQKSYTLADTASDPFELYTQGARALFDSGEQGYEYAVGISKNIKLGDIQKQDRQIANLQTEASRLEGEIKVVAFKNTLRGVYHQHCIDKEIYKNIKENYLDFLKLYKKKQKSYKYQEISKTELMHLESEKNTLLSNMERVKTIQSISRQKVLILSGTNIDKNIKLSCRDIYPVRNKVALGDLFRLSKQAKQKRIQSTQTALKRYNHTIESISLNGQYGKELDSKRYTIGVSLPLQFTSLKNEHAKASAMYKASAIYYDYKQSMREKKAYLFELKTKLSAQANMVKKLSKNYQRYKSKLMPLIKKSYELGETSVIEYLMNRQKLHLLAQEIYANKRSYYDTLFELYTLVEKRD